MNYCDKKLKIYDISVKVLKNCTKYLRSVPSLLFRECVRVEEKFLNLKMHKATVCV